MEAIQEYTEGSLAKTKKSNEVIKAMNAFIKMRFELNEEGKPPEIKFADNNVVLSISKRDVTICENGSPVDISILSINI